MDLLLQNSCQGHTICFILLFFCSEVDFSSKGFCGNNSDNLILDVRHTVLMLTLCVATLCESSTNKLQRCRSCGRTWYFCSFVQWRKTYQDEAFPSYCNSISSSANDKRFIISLNCCVLRYSRPKRKLDMIVLWRFSVLLIV